MTSSNPGFLLFLVITSFLVSLSASSPTNQFFAGLSLSEDAGETTKSNPVGPGNGGGGGEHRYEHGELPPAQDTIGWTDPRLNGGRFLDFTTKRLGEPLNIIISAQSDPYVLTEEGLHIYSKSIGFSEECFGMHYGHIHEADLGDGLGRKGEHFLARQHYMPVIGTCWESVRGGHHFRAWKQNGTVANSGAWFLGASKEKDSSRNHKITEDGYNLGRDFIVDRATAGSRWKGMWWKADVQWQDGLLQKGRRGVNHGIPQDGRVAVLTVRRL